MTHLSDAAFLDWKRACAAAGADVKGLKHIFFSTIPVDWTKQTVKRVLGHDGQESEFWDSLPTLNHKVCFAVWNEGGMALLGTVHMRAVLWMLIQHRQDLGWKKILRVCIFRDPDLRLLLPRRRGPGMYVELVDHVERPSERPPGAVRVQPWLRYDERPA